MNTLKFALGAMIAAGLSAALPAPAHAQYPGQPYGGGNSGANSALAQSRKAIKEAELEVTKIRSEMTKMKARVAQKFEGKEEWETAQKNLKAAEAAHEQARKRALAKLYASPEYKAAKDKLLKAEQLIASIGAKDGSSKDMDKAQQDRLDAGLAVRKMETEALRADPKIAETKDQEDEAKKTWEALQDELKEALELDADYVAAQQQLETAQAQVDTMKAQLAQQAASERQMRRQQQESMRNSGRSGRGGRGGAGY